MTQYDSTDTTKPPFDDAVEKKTGKQPAFVYVLTLLSAIGGFLFGYDTGVVSGAMLLVRKRFELNTAWHEAIVSSTIAAAWVFALAGGYLTDRFGRKPVILGASFVFTAGSIIMGVAETKEVLLVGRIVVGIGIGLASMSVPMFIAESALPESRGWLVTLNNIFITGGQFVASVICGGFSSVDEGWRYMLGLAAIPACLQFFGFLGMPESPRWLVSKKRYDEALSVLKSIRGKEFLVEEELESIKQSNLEQEREIEARISSGGSKFLIVQIFQSPSTRRALLLGSLLLSFQQLAGINTVMYYSASIIQMAGISDISLAIWLAAVTASVNFMCTFIGLYLVERVGRRSLTLGSLGGVIVALLVLGISFHLTELDAPSLDGGSQECLTSGLCSDCILLEECGFCFSYTNTSAVSGFCVAAGPLSPESGSKEGNCTDMPSDDFTWAYNWCPSEYSWISIVALGVYLLFFAPGMGPMPWTVNSEIYPLWARSTCNSIATSCNCLFNLLVSMTFLTLTEVLAKQGAFYLYAGITIVGFIIFFFIMPETKGKSLEEMETLFTGPWCMKCGRRDSKSIQSSQPVHHDRNDDLPLNTFLK